MKKFLMQLIILGLVVYYILPEFVSGISIAEPRTAIIAAILFAIINFAVKPLVRIITLPINLITFGLFGLLINVALFWIVAEITTGFMVLNFTAAFWGALILTIASGIANALTD